MVVEQETCYQQKRKESVIIYIYIYKDIYIYIYTHIEGVEQTSERANGAESGASRLVMPNSPHVFASRLVSSLLVGILILILIIIIVIIIIIIIVFLLSLLLLLLFGYHHHPRPRRHLDDGHHYY